MIKLTCRPSRPSTVTWRRLTASTSSCSSIGRPSRSSWCRCPSTAARQSAATTAGPTPRHPHRDPPSTRPFRGSRIDTVMKAKPRLMSSARSYRLVNLCWNPWIYCFRMIKTIIWRWFFWLNKNLIFNNLFSYKKLDLYSHIKWISISDENRPFSKKLSPDFL